VHGGGLFRVLALEVFVGDGEHRIEAGDADNATLEGRQRNRRVAITMESRTPDTPVEVAIPE
jgi:hypothetical protein